MQLFGGSAVDEAAMLLAVFPRKPHREQEQLISRLADSGAVIMRVAPLADTVNGVSPSEQARSGDGLQVTCGIELDEGTRRVHWQGTELDVTAREFDLLWALAAPPARAWSFESLARELWQDGDGSLDAERLRSTVKRLRRKMREFGIPMRIESVRGWGYRLSDKGSALDGDGGLRVMG